MKVEQRPSYVGVEIPGKASDPISQALQVLRSELMRIYLCQSGKYATPGATLNVSRSIGKVWRQIGGDIAIEARYVTGPRHLVDKLRWIAPVSVFVGAKSWAVFAVQWDEDQKSWKGLGDG